VSEAARKVAAGVVETLSRQADVYGDLLDVACKKREVLAGGTVRDLEHLVQAEEALLFKAGRLEERRSELVDELSRLCGIDGKVTVRELIERVDGLDDALEEIDEALKRVLEELGAVNRTNAELIRQALAYINLSLSVTAGAGRDVTYTEGGTIAPGAVRRGVVDREL